jgi:hypothetical protein
MFSILISCDSDKKEHDAITQSDINLMKKNHIIPLKKAVKMYDKYSKDRAKILKDTLKKKYGNDFNDTRNVWIDIKTIKAYLKYIEQESKDSIEGLGFYFSVDLDNTGAKKNHQTFFIAPTQKNGDKQSGFTIVDGKTKFLYEAFKENTGETGQNVQKASFFSMMQGDSGLLLNKNSDSPPGGNN